MYNNCNPFTFIYDFYDQSKPVHEKNGSMMWKRMKEKKPEISNHFASAMIYMENQLLMFENKYVIRSYNT